MYLDSLERKAIVIGATGLVGGLLVRSLLQNPAYSRILVLVRRPLNWEHPKLETIRSGLGTLEDQRHLFREIDDLYCCLGTTIKKAGSQENFRQVDYHYPVQAAKLAKEQDVSQMLVISSMGAAAGSRVFYSRTKGEMEEALSAVGFHSLHVFRPSLILGDRKENGWVSSWRLMYMKFLDRWMKGRVDKYRAIHASTIAQAMINIALVQQRGIMCIPMTSFMHWEWMRLRDDL